MFHKDFSGVDVVLLSHDVFFLSASVPMCDTVWSAKHTVWSIRSFPNINPQSSKTFLCCMKKYATPGETFADQVRSRTKDPVGHIDGTLFDGTQ